METEVIHECFDRPVVFFLVVTREQRHIFITDRVNYLFLVDSTTFLVRVRLLLMLLPANFATLGIKSWWKV